MPSPRGQQLAGTPPSCPSPAFPALVMCASPSPCYSRQTATRFVARSSDLRRACATFSIAEGEHFEGTGRVLTGVGSVCERARRASACMRAAACPSEPQASEKSNTVHSTSCALGTWARATIANLDFETLLQVAAVEKDSLLKLVAPRDGAMQVLKTALKVLRHDTGTARSAADSGASGEETIEALEAAADPPMETPPRFLMGGVAGKGRRTEGTNVVGAGGVRMFSMGPGSSDAGRSKGLVATGQVSIVLLVCVHLWLRVIAAFQDRSAVVRRVF